MTSVTIPDFALVVLIGATGSGKSTFAERHFKPTEIVSSDHCRALVSDNESDQTVTSDAFALVREIAARRLKNRRLTVIDATNVRAADRRQWIDLARDWHALPVAIVLDVDPATCAKRNATRGNRPGDPAVPRRMSDEIRRGLKGLAREGFRHVTVLDTQEAIDHAQLQRVPLWTDRREDTGPFDVIGDVHGCADELQDLLASLGYAVVWSGTGEERQVSVTPPAGRKAVFVGDLCDRGPNTPDVLRVVMRMVQDGCAYCVQGNHDDKLARALAGRKVTVAHGLQASLDQLARESPDFRAAAGSFLSDLRSHYWLDGGRLAVAHAGIREDMIGRGSAAVRSFTLYGDTTGDTDEDGLPVRQDWAADYRGATAVVYGHVVVPSVEWVNNTINIDTGCVFGGRLTALRWPEREIVQVPARAVWCEPLRRTPKADDGLSAQADADSVLDVSDVAGKRFIDTALRGRIMIPEENAAAALEILSRFTAAPQWLVYLPPTMSPPETSARDGDLERPEEAFEYYARRGIETVVCEEKHMGSRAVIVVARGPEAVRRRFGIDGDAIGAVLTRTGRSFLADSAMAAAALERVQYACEKAGLWEELATDWVVLDAEIMPWSAKAGALISSQYAPVAAAAVTGLDAAGTAIARAAARGVPVADWVDRLTERAARAARYAQVWSPYVWPVVGPDDLKIAPFHVLASENRLWFDADHTWHMGWADRLAATAAITPTRWRRVVLGDAASVRDAVGWWEDLTASGGEGCVVKPLAFTARGSKGLIQPAIKVRGHEYLRLIYGPEYDAPENLGRLKERGLGAKRDLALREFALGHEALRRFVAGEPLRRVHECVAGILALESEPVDPRL